MEKNPITDQLLAAAVRFSEDSIVITDTQLNPPGPHIIYVNPGFTKMTGYKPEEVYGKTPRILQGPKTDRAVLDRLKATLKKGEVFFGVAVNYRKDGSEFYNEWHIEPIRTRGRISHYLAIQRDVTERVRIQKMIEAKNIALQEVIAQIEFQKKQLHENILINVEKVILPSLEKLRRKSSRLEVKHIDAIKQSLKDLTSDFARKAGGAQFGLSPKELEIAALIRQGLSGKDIAKSLSMSFKTVETHRFNIRRKLGLLNQNVNLAAFLQSV
ncbi:MAG: PAS domain S-box protein [Candidatus Omnitrophica bacterium]|nr:PAS domain S-box protein [Candidatus Omnitrophota bacterium]MDE2222102.1 PAS domain S-box protein [Candidatus Omnitrophota bacterium]